VLCNNNTAVPPVPMFAADTTGAGNCGTAHTGTIYMGLVPSNPSPNGAAYMYTGPAGGATYSITFSLEGATGQLSAGGNCANQNGIQAGSSC
jgi:hypothetical protein